MKAIRAAVFLGLFMAGHAQAQNIVMMNNGGARQGNPENNQHISVNFQLSVPAPALAATPEWTRAMTNASQSLYDIVNRECDVLSASLNGDCRLTQLNVGGNMGNRMNAGNTSISVNANATFEIVPKAQPTVASPQH